MTAVSAARPGCTSPSQYMSASVMAVLQRAPVVRPQQQRVGIVAEAVGGDVQRVLRAMPEHEADSQNLRRTMNFTPCIHPLFRTLSCTSALTIHHAWNTAVRTCRMQTLMTARLMVAIHRSRSTACRLAICRQAQHCTISVRLALNCNSTTGRAAGEQHRVAISLQARRIRSGMEAAPMQTLLTAELRIMFDKNVKKHIYIR